MAREIFCDCGARLVEDVTRDGVKPLGGDPITFRRTTDYVMCPNCHKLYRAATLLSGGSLEESFIEKLEELVEGGDDTP